MPFFSGLYKWHAILVSVITLSSFVHCSGIFNIFKQALIQPQVKPRQIVPIVKPTVDPVLVVVDPITNCKVHLVGVSHGSEASSYLVRQTMAAVSPKAVVVELCDDRFLAISLDAQIRPRNNRTIIQAYNEKRLILDKRKSMSSGNKSLANAGISNLASNIMATFRFAKSQGVVGGLFVTLGLTVGYLQRLMKSSSGDEFVTAMQVAEAMNIPVKLGDAPQNDTLRSIRTILSPETFDLKEVMSGSKHLAFSALGLSVESSNVALSGHIKSLGSELLSLSQFISIPRVYGDNPQLFKSLLPLLFVGLASTAVSVIPFVPAPDSLTATSSTTAYEISSWSSFVAAVAAAFTTDLPVPFENFLNSVVNVIAVLFLIRMSKLIGTDRDSIIASKVQSVCKEFPVR